MRALSGQLYRIELMPNYIFCVSQSSALLSSFPLCMQLVDSDPRALNNDLPFVVVYLLL